MSGLFDSIRAKRDKRIDTGVGTRLANGQFGNASVNDPNAPKPAKSRFRTPTLEPTAPVTPHSIRKPRF
jgi:hypothetical protein